MSDQPPLIETELLEAMKPSWESESRFFSNDGKEERERWVVSEFLSSLSIAFAIEDIHSHEQRSEVDVEFRGALSNQGDIEP